MSDVLAPVAADAPLSLYIDLKEGAKADLVAIAQASLALAATAREIAYVFDPSLDLKIELMGSHDGSLWLDTKLRALGVTSTGQKLSVGIVAGSLLTLLVNNIAGTGIQDLIHEYLWSAPSSPPFTQEMMDEALARAVKNLNCGVAKTEIQSVYRALNKDENIIGVGAARTSHERPKFVVPQEQFAIRAGAPSEKMPIPDKRTFEKRLPVVVVKPVLLEKEDRDRSWTISIGGREYGAKMRDKKFTHDIAAGFYPVKMQAGIQLDALIEFKEEFEGGAWKNYERNIKEVYDVFPPGQKALSLPREAKP